MDTFVAYAIAGLAGVAGIGLGMWWDHIVTKHNWKGWDLDEYGERTEK